MTISADKVGKRFLNSWIFRDISLELKSGVTYALIGHNGSGKSTLLQILAGYLSPSEGEVIFKDQGNKVKRDDIHKFLSFCSPYTELIEELTLEEHLDFHQKFRPFVDDLDVNAVMEIMELEREWDKEVRFFSSGMKQRLKLALSILSQSGFILLDEPSTNLDQASTQWFLNLLEKYRGDRIVVIASNVEADLQLCTDRISVEQYK